jgi:PAS domain S-box-containing protein
MSNDSVDWFAGGAGDESIRVRIHGGDLSSQTIETAGADLAVPIVAVDENGAPCDCLIVSDATTAASAAGGTDPPTVLYTATDPVDLSPETLDAVDAVVEQRTGGTNIDFLVEKIAAVTDYRRGSSTGAVERAAGTDTAAFFVDSTGSVRWTAGACEQLFPESDSESGSLYEHIGRQLRDSPSEIAPMLELPETESQRGGHILPVPRAGGTRYYRHHSYPIATPGASRVEIFSDVTAEIEAYDRLSVAEDVAGCLFVLDTSARVVFLTEPFAEMLGYEQSELLGTHLSAILRDDGRERCRTALSELLGSDEKRKTLDFDFETKTGGKVRRRVTLSVQRTDGPTAAGRIGIVRVTDRRTHEEDSCYEAIFQAIGDPVCTFDDDGRFVRVNGAFEQTTGYDQSSVRGESATLVVDESAVQRLRSVESELLADGKRQTDTLEVELETTDGDRIPTECHVSLLPTEDSRERSVVVMRDISERTEREQRLSEFASLVSHDLRNPLDVALGRAKMLPEIADVDEEIEEHLQEIYDSLKHMEHLIEDVLTLTRQRDDDLDVRPVSLEEVARDAWSHVQTDDASLSIAGEQPILADRGRLLRLLENLFRNAVEHAGSEVAVEAGLADLDPTAGTAAVYVADDGPGIPPDTRERIFEEGFSTDQNGTGLGLSIVHAVARAHGWTATVTESASSGARFEFADVALHSP